MKLKVIVLSDEINTTVIVVQAIDVKNHGYINVCKGINYQILYPQIFESYIKKALDKVIKEYIEIEKATTKLDDYLS